MVLVALAATALLLIACSGDPESSSADQSRWSPEPTTAPWQFQLQGKIDTSIPAPVYEVDGFDVSARTVRELQAGGRKVICYIDVGSWERYRSDAGRFPRSVIGKTYEGYPNERWLDIRRFREFAGPLRDRIEMCARKGFDGLEPDNIAGFENRTGFPIRAKHQIRFNRWIARQAHRRGLAAALKNDGRQAKKLVGNFDFAVVEQCFQYNECGQYRPFIRSGKPVFEVEYEIGPGRFCSKAERMGFSAIGKQYDLYARPWRPCRGGGS
ncbi:MAG: endo alpha-1,4 polygalactosaminidase [Thermoleophilia bacterium]|nr:endo alpha-1,4 polygalactosaminidase [Thermoleophilia bacterium]